MSLIQRTKQDFLRLPFLKQVVLVSSLALMLSPLLPWYDERNSFGIGESYLGVQGPFFLIGLMVMAFGLISAVRIKKSGLISFFMGIQSLLLLVVANSIFFHPEFGANISSKTTRFGMTFAFICLGVLAISGWLARNKEPVSSEEIITLSNLSTVEAPRKPLDVPVQTSFTQPLAPTPVTPTSDVDPLTLDPRTRYKLMQSRMRQQGNYWGGVRSSGAGHYGPTPSSIHAEPNHLDV